MKTHEVFGILIRNERSEGYIRSTQKLYAFIDRTFQFRFRFRQVGDFVKDVACLRFLIISSYLANPEFVENSIEYYQNKVSVLEKYIKEHSLEENKILIDKYLELVKNLWRVGFSDNTFKFDRNYVLYNGQIVLIDFNEATFSIEDVKRDIQNKAWLKKYSYKRLNRELREYYKKRMQEELNVENLEKLWNNKRI